MAQFTLSRSYHEMSDFFYKEVNVLNCDCTAKGAREKPSCAQTLKWHGLCGPLNAHLRTRRLSAQIKRHRAHVHAAASERHCCFPCLPTDARDAGGKGASDMCVPFACMPLGWGCPSTQRHADPLLIARSARNAPLQGRGHTNPPFTLLVVRQHACMHWCATVIANLRMHVTAKGSGYCRSMNDSFAVACTALAY